jgi:hypothetical protein
VSKEKGIYFHVSEKEKTKIAANAKKCGLKQSEYLRQRALGYEPKPALPGDFYAFTERLDKLIDKDISPKITAEALQLLREISNVLIKPRKEVVQKWQPPDSGRSKAV